MRPCIVSRTAAVGALLAVAFLAAACARDDGPPPTGSPAPASAIAGATQAPAVAGEIMVFAAASLTDGFTEISEAFEAQHPDASVRFQFAGSPALLTQLDEGAKADLFATADAKNMEAARERGVVADGGTVFARNKLVIIVPKENPGQVFTPADLAESGLRFVLAGAEVPAGRYARESLDLFAADAGFGAQFASDVLANIVSEEPNVKAVVTKVQLGEADAGIVYVTDVTAGVNEDVMTIDIPDRFNIIATYPIAVTAETGNAGRAQAFIDFVLSQAGQTILEEHGFIPIE